VIAAVARLTAAVGSFAVFGWLALDAMRWPADRRSPWERLSLAYALGLGLLPLALLLIALAGARLEGPALALPWLAVAAAAAPVWRRRVRDARAARAPWPEPAPPPAPAAPPAARAHRRWSALEIALLALLVAVGASAVLIGALVPLYKFDAWAQIAFKAKVLYMSRDLDGFFARPELLHYQNADYPLLVPLVEVWVSIVTGRFDDAVVKLPVAALYPALLVLFAGALEARRLPRAGALAGALALSAVYHLRYSATVGYADFPLAAYTFLAFDRLLGRDAGATERPGPAAHAALAGLFAAFAAFAKNEGFVVVAGLVGVWLADVRLRAPRGAAAPRPARLALFLALALLPNVPWLLFRSARGLRTALLSGGAAPDLSRVPTIVGSLADEARNIERWSLLWPLAAAAGSAALVTALRARANGGAERAGAAWAPPALAACVLAAAMLAAAVAVIATAPFSVDFLLGTSGDRILTHVVPLAVYAAALAASAGLDGRAPRVAARPSSSG
jgi:hypothetical protein